MLPEPASSLPGGERSKSSNHPPLVPALAEVSAAAQGPELPSAAVDAKVVARGRKGRGKARLSKAGADPAKGRPVSGEVFWLAYIFVII